MELQDIDLGYLIERETGDKFNRKGYIRCPFHSEKTPSLSIKFFPNANKYKFKCFGCGEAGDALDFIMKLKGIGYKEAREYLGMNSQKSQQELQEEKVRGYIEWEIKNTEHRRDKLLLGLFPFTNERNEIVYIKAKFRDKEGKKSLSYYHIDGNGKVINRRNGEELPYNLYRAIKAIKEGKAIVICEGEKDVNNLNSIFKGQAYEAASVKGVKDLKIFGNAERLFVCGDTGKAGEEYKQHIKSQLFTSAEEFRFINLPGLEDLGDNKDVTDWLEAGHTPKELMTAFNRSLDLKNKYELQQDGYGIYKYITKGKGEEAEEVKIYLTNFNLISATRIR
ncbi:MAG: CHC2 zinc finger domain-containing protein, partial [Bacillota bacterium]|nr:CHC2 zinc finger domain-containing protein [Bacillota bacterium]